MRIFFSPIPAAEPGRFLTPGRSAGAQSAAAWSLLLYALREMGEAERLPEPGTDGCGRPCFPSRPELCFSLSHTRGWVLCALGRERCGADVQLISPRDAAFAPRLMDAREREDFSLHELWCLRESLYKLLGGGDLRAWRFRREGGLIVPPAAGTAARLYTDVPGCAAAAAAFSAGALPGALERVDAAALLR